MGDIEFQDARAQTVRAYEAHGGRLTDEYVRGHAKSLERLIERRIDEEWGSSDGWSVAVTFVAHEVSDMGTQHVELHGVPVTLAFVTYQSWFDDLFPEGYYRDARERMRTDFLTQLREIGGCAGAKAEGLRIELGARYDAAMDEIDERP